MIQTALLKLSSGEAMAFPTETVYGLGADCTNDSAVQKIFTLKGRPAFNPLIIHVSDIHMAFKYGEFNDTARTLANKFWPGPLTIVVPLNKNAKISSYVTAGLDTIAIRCPNHPVALDLLQQYNVPIAAPSANISGYVSPTKYEHVHDEFGDKVFIVPGDQSCIGLESTIVDCSVTDVAILRPGFITKENIETILNMPLTEKTSSEVIKAPGQFKLHYSPKLPVRLNVTNVHPNEALLNFGQNALTADISLNLSPQGNLDEAATNLFDYLRKLDKHPNITGIAVSPIPCEKIGVAINERLDRAASK
ncbi:MAG: threonylcarbamoyl-AMP synthase [Candidatus Paracaedibacteraceae bacterium]|nr:threonylcarbamoyl-AMP synthase [Candidatus Paracaedibacteraceae bacterium]